MNTTEAIAHLTGLGYTVTAPKMPAEARDFIDNPRRRLVNAKDDYDRNNAVYGTYDYIRKTWDIGEFNRIKILDTFAPDLAELCIKSKLWRNWR